MDDEELFRVEQWALDDDRLLRTLARSSEHPIILAAWHAAIRTTPGARLALKNSTFTMDTIVTPGSRPADPRTIINGKVEPFEASVKDLRQFHQLRGYCMSCRHDKRFSREEARDKFGLEARLVDIEKRLRCSACGEKNVQLQIHNVPR